mmetsp:Transcript_24837/g.54006  ORF Transcript_24837/g.54006 Transcript_24837/m.54006 type:complete len:587 (-) Transcript_24837:516-2276(-)|eukprot:CAMPEP_0206536468 /NCGR_PEP_ID=MMETSP0325_2-20121206/6763_1 /ASSEMBLY_ACC=CAM_ASM_000347 /TAXON_ID=2866 /ORGANISM="Crypthecodinium cohnii, Strain Seligo" /LENGTH=586 /DNA_ID=CAMNT_0054033677 /DNA_START=37 /DNA_END=1797 /DNA_ORIENTATION=+
MESNLESSPVGSPSKPGATTGATTPTTMTPSSSFSIPGTPTTRRRPTTPTSTMTPISSAQSSPPKRRSASMSGTLSHNSSNSNNSNSNSGGGNSRRGSSSTRAGSKGVTTIPLAKAMPRVLKISIGPGQLDCSARVTVTGGKPEAGGLPEVCPANKTSTASWVASSVCRGPSTRGTLHLVGFEPVGFSVAHNDQGQTFIHSKGKWRHTLLAAAQWDWRGNGDRPTEGKAADLEVCAGSYADRAPVLKVSVRPCTEMELKRYLQLRALQEAQEDADYDTLHAQVTKAKLAGVEMVAIERGLEKLADLRKQGLHVSEGADKESLKKLMCWDQITRLEMDIENKPCTVTEDCPCNDPENCGEVLEITSNAVQECLARFGEEADRLLFEELSESALAVQEGSVWKAGGKFIFSAFDRNQSVNALTRMLNGFGRNRCSQMLLEMVKHSEAKYGGYVTSVQINFHPHGGTFHAQHRDIYSAKQRAGPNCTCSFRKCVGTVCYSVGSTRACLLETMTDDLSALTPCCAECQGREETRWLHSGDAMFFNEAWNANHTHGIPNMREILPSAACGPRISVAFLLGAEEERAGLFKL